MTPRFIRSARSGLYRPLSATEERIAYFLQQTVPPPPWTPSGMQHIESARARYESDAQFRALVDERMEELSWIQFLRIHGGSGLEMSRRLRFYLAEYINRQLAGSVHSYPSSFNIVESFMSFDRRLCFFDLREEREHIADLDAYFYWYENFRPKTRTLLSTFLDEGIIYSYNITSQSRYRVQLDNSEIIIAGLSMVRHGEDVSLVVSAGESPSHPSDEAVETLLAMSGEAPIGKEHLKPGEEWDVSKRYMESTPEYCSVIFLARLNIHGEALEVRYVNVDMGSSYLVYTDDEVTLANSLPQEELIPRIRIDDHMLSHYGRAFSAATAMLFLPVFVLENQPSERDCTFKTELFVRRRTRAVKQAIARFGNDVRLDRRVKAIRAPRPTEPRISVEIDCIESTQGGYWKVLSPGEVGEDRDGNHIVGRTWVSRLDTWNRQKLGAFVASLPITPDGPDPGTVYVMRSPSHGSNVYKIGLTRRSAKERARELSSATASPLPFEVNASWEVGDCALVEREAHRRLSKLRVNPRREFFKAELRQITMTIHEILSEQPNS